MPIPNVTRHVFAVRRLFFPPNLAVLAVSLPCLYRLELQKGLPLRVGDRRKELVLARLDAAAHLNGKRSEGEPAYEGHEERDGRSPEGPHVRAMPLVPPERPTELKLHGLVVLVYPHRVVLVRHVSAAAGFQRSWRM